MSSQLRSRYDIVINGGGIVGFTLLNLILKSPHLNRSRVLLIEQAKKPANFNQPPRTRGEDEEGVFSNRVSSITYASKVAYKKLGVWDLVRPYTKDVKKIKVWNYDYMHKINFKQDLSPCQRGDKEERDIVFSTLENDRLSQALLDRIHKHDGARGSIAWSSKLINLEESLESGLVDVIYSEPDKHQDSVISASLILGCDGYKSKIRELTQMRYSECDLKNTALVGTVKMSTQLTNSENDVAYQKFSATKDTVAALLPLDQEYSSFVISAPDYYAKHLKDCDEETFVNEFNQLLSSRETPSNIVLKGLHEFANSSYDNLKSLLQIIGPRLGLAQDGLDIDDGFEEVPSIARVMPESRAIFPLIFGTTSPRMISSLPNLERTQIALLGDAAHRVHPLAGQGLNLGIQDAVELVKQLEFVASTGERLFHDTKMLSKALRRYELKRQVFVIPMSVGILFMQDLFKLAPSGMITSVNKCPIIKTATVRIANGV